MPKPRIFLSYRQNDSMAETRNIKVWFERAGFEHVFIDQAMKPGDKWQKRIADELLIADVVIVVIGKSWLSDGNRRRLSEPEDPVRRELLMALDHGKTIVPALVAEAVMPAAEDLPPELRGIVGNHGKSLTPKNWDGDIAALISSVDGSRADTAKAKVTIVLASKSPRREQLLRTIGWIEGEHYFSVHASVTSDDSQDVRTIEEAREFAKRMARRKIAWLRENRHKVSEETRTDRSAEETILIGVDTIVFCRGKVLDRPLLTALEFAGPPLREQARKRAEEMLHDQRGQTVHVITGLAVAMLGARDDPETTDVVTETKLRDYPDSDIDSYLACAEPPVDKAGAFGIHDQGVSLVERIKGSYTNIVGLPLREFVNLMQKEYGSVFVLPELRSMLVAKDVGAANPRPKALSVVCVGDINYDFVYDKFPFSVPDDLRAPGKAKVTGEIRRAVGGTAVNFAKGAKRAGFDQCFVVGSVGGGDALGKQIEAELGDLEIEPIIDQDPAAKTSVTLIIGREPDNDYSLMITDTRHQSLSAKVMDRARVPIEKSDVVYCSGCCLTDGNRYSNAIKILREAKERDPKGSDCLVVMDVVANLRQEDIPSVRPDQSLGQDEARSLVDVLVAEMPEILSWFDVAAGDSSELDAWQANKDLLESSLRKLFPVTVVRTRNYTHELIVTPDRVEDSSLLDYGTLPLADKAGYGHVRAAKQVHSFLSPRIVLASKSPQRRELLQQIVAPSKIQVIASNCPEDHREGESPEQRVRRVALEKAERVLSSGDFHDDIELIIGADTEIGRQKANGQWELIGHPTSLAQARKDLNRLNKGDHRVFTGLAVIGKAPGTQSGQLKRYVGCEQTRITFIAASRAQLDEYAKSGEPIGRAGAYAIQGLGTMLVESIDGSYSNVVGLPLERLSQVMADEFGKPIWNFDKVSGWTFPDPIKGWR